ncbi:hypothetical protein [Methylomonas sp. YC3]
MKYLGSGSTTRLAAFCEKPGMVRFGKLFNMISLRLLLFSLVIAMVACDDGYLRGSVTISSDGKTYLVVVDDNGCGCGPIIVDGKIWSYMIGEAGLITPGHHKIQCGGWIEFDIPEGVVFHFDYWGP